MAQPAAEVFKYLLSASLRRDLAGAVGWSFAAWRNGKEFLSLCGGFARAPWEATDPAAPMTPDKRFQTASLSKMISGWGLMLAVDDWNRVLTKAQEFYSTVLRPELSARDAWPPDVASALPRLPSPDRDRLLNSVVQQTGLPQVVVGRVFQQPVRLSLDTKLVDLLGLHLSGVRFGTNVQQLTLRHCLTHTTQIDWGAVPDGYDGNRDVGMNWTEAGKNVAYLRALLSKPLLGTPGTTFSYHSSNTGLVRFAIEECIAGERPEAYEHFIRSRAFLPLGIYHAECAAPGDVLYYGQLPPAPGRGPGSPSTRTAAANGWWAAPRDLAKWLDARTREPLGKEWLTREVFVAPTKTGWFPRDSSSTGLPSGVIAHNGSAGAGGGVTAMMGVLPNNMTVALMVNSEPELTADSVFDRAFAALQPVIEFPPPYVEGKVRIRNPLRFGEVWYTLNGSEPTPNAAGSTLYASDSAIPRSSNMKVRASVWEDGSLLTGPVAAQAAELDPNAKRPALNPDVATASGIRWSYVTGFFRFLSEVGGFEQQGAIRIFAPEIPSAVKFTTSTVLPGSSRLPPLRNWNYAMEFAGYIDAPADGTYTFSTTSDDGSRLWVGDTLLVDNDGLHGATTKTGPGIALKQGKHPVKITFMQGAGDQALEVKWSGPGMTERVLDFSRLSYVP